MNADRLAHDLSSRQGGAIRLEQALDIGLTRNQIGHRIRTGRWSKLIRGSYLVSEMTSVDDYLRAAVATLPDAVVSHESAAELHGLSYIERGLATVMVHTQTTHEFPGVIARRCHDLVPEHVEPVSGLPVTTPPRTIVDLASLVSKRNLEAVLDDAVTAKLTNATEIGAVFMDVGRSGKPGTKNLRRLLLERSGPLENATPLERKGGRLLLTMREAVPVFEYPIPWRPERRFDAAYPDHQLAIEWDSRRYHERAEAFERDRQRDREAVIHGWRILRFTWEDVTERPDEVIATVRQALAQSSA